MGKGAQRRAHHQAAGTSGMAGQDGQRPQAMPISATRAPRSRHAHYQAATGSDHQVMGSGQGRNPIHAQGLLGGIDKYRFTVQQAEPAVIGLCEILNVSLTNTFIPTGIPGQP